MVINKPVDIETIQHVKYVIIQSNDISEDKIILTTITKFAMMNITSV